MDKKILGASRRILETLGYKLNERKFPDVKDFFSEDYIRIIPPYPENHIVYSGMEHKGRPKLPNITLLPHLRIGLGHILGSTMGHQHTQDEEFDLRRFQELYEFHGYGGMLLRNKDGANFHILSAGQKVLVGTDENMTIFNLDNYPLVTLDYANIEKNSANKNLERRIGTFMLMKENTKDVFIKLNKEYYNEILIKGDYGSGCINIEKTKLGEELHEKIFQYKDKFNEKGINLVIGGNIPQDLKKEFSPPLIDLVLTQNKRLFDELGVDQIGE